MVLVDPGGWCEKGSSCAQELIQRNAVPFDL